MLAREGYFTIFLVTLFALFMSALGYYIGHWTQYLIYALMIGLVALILNFFRDPDRNIPDEEDAVLAPADGKVVLIKEVEEPDYIKGKALQVSIFLSVLDVHVNRNPMSGTLEHVKYHPGIYLVAWHDDASNVNERADFGVKHPSGLKIFYRQITGFLARRIVYHVSEGDQLEAGKRFGMMKFGSRMDILVPSDTELLVREGQKTVAGETLLGRLASTSSQVSGSDQGRTEITNS